MARVSVSWKANGRTVGRLSATELVSKTALRDAGTYLARELVQRTQSGRDEHNRRFKPYSPNYAHWKGVPRTAVDLTLTGQMLRDYGVIAVTRRSVRVGFRSAAMATRAIKNERLGRAFLGVSDKWLREIRRRLGRSVGFNSVGS